MFENRHGALKRLLNAARLTHRTAAAMVVVMMAAGAAALTPLRALRLPARLGPLRRGHRARLRGLGELVGESLRMSPRRSLPSMTT